MRGVWLLVAFVVGSACSFDSGGQVGDDDASSVDAAADAVVVECTTDQQCETPPTLCHLSGLCNPATQRCEFPQKDCSSADDQCNAGTCEPATGDCVPTPANDGEDCNGGTTCGSFGSCGDFDPGDVCDETGTRSRDCTDRICSSGACIDVNRVESEGCTRDQDGVTCQSTMCGSFSSCAGFSGTCDETGTRSRDCTSYACSSGTCASSDFVDVDNCTRGSRDGISCAADECGPYGSCMGFSDTCDESGIRQRTCTPYECDNQSCDPATPFTQTDSCSRDTDGDMCGEDCAEVCSGMGDCPSSCSGTCTSVCSDVFCSGGTCGG